VAVLLCLAFNTQRIWPGVIVAALFGVLTGLFD
jgi:hypothetical protein